MLHATLWNLKMIQIQVVFIIIGGVVSVPLDTHCKQYTKQNYTEDLSGYLGEKFLILVDADTTQYYFEGMCVNEHVPQPNIVTSSNGIKTKHTDKTFVDILKIPSQKFGTAILLFTEAVQVISQSYSQMLPLERLGTEYFIILPNVQVKELFAHICTLDTNTTVAIEITNVGTKLENSSLVRQLGSHQIWTVSRTFDFSGSRVLSTDTVAIFAGFNTAVTIAQQLLPGYVFGKQYGVSNDIMTFAHRTHKITVRLLAMFDKTDIWTASDAVNTVGANMLRGELRELDISSKKALTVISDKRFIVFLQNGKISWNYVAPVGQFVNSLIRYSGNEKNVTVFYKMLANQTADISVELVDFFTGNPLYALHKQQDIFNDTIMRYGELRLNITSHWVYIYLSSRELLGMMVRWTMDNAKISSTHTETWRFHTAFQDCKLVKQSCGDDCERVDSCQLLDLPKASEEETEHKGILIGFVATMSFILAIAFPARAFYRTVIKRKKRVRPQIITESTTPSVLTDRND